MCTIVPRKIVKILANKAKLDDGREVRVGLIKNIKVGDYLEVYGDLVLGKIIKDHNSP